MKLKNSLLLIAIVAVAVGVVLGASAYTTFSMDRSANIDVVDDTQGILALSPGSSSFVASNNGQVGIDVTNGGATGVNVNSQLDIGNASTPTSDYAFTVTNNDNSAHDLNMSYTGVTADGDSAANVQFEVFDSGGASVGTFDETGALNIAGAPSGATYYVVLTVDTTGSTTADDLSGTVSFTAK